MTTPNPTRRTTYCKSVGQPFRAPARVSCGLGGLGMDSWPLSTTIVYVGAVRARLYGLLIKAVPSSIRGPK